MGALGHFLEREGIATSQISLIREQTAAIKPPRALWVPFMLGRPFGAPDAPDFQRKVLHALLMLFERPAGPVLEDFPEDAPAGSGDDAEVSFACPVSFAKATVDDGNLAAALQREIAQLAPWYDLAKKRRGRSTVGISGMSIEGAASHTASYLDATPAAPYAGLSAGVALKRACDDLKAYYYEAVAAQPGNLKAKDIERWFWRETAAARVFLAIQQVCLKSTDKSLLPLGKISLVPRAVQHALTEVKP
ncbi:MAG: hypothetical protein ACO1PN_01740 [Betaproteobacteria bacterium]